jgi:hypothetical protein
MASVAKHNRRLTMYRKIATAAVTALVLATASSAAMSKPRSAAAGFQGEAPAWSFACLKDNGPTQCGEPIWIYGN